MAQEAEDRGLCSACDHAPGCALPASHKKPVFYCEEFYSEELTTARALGGRTAPPAQRVEPQERSPTDFIGLCSDCENRDTCVFVNPEGGVWHCEEYE